MMLVGFKGQLSLIALSFVAYITSATPVKANLSI